MVRQGENLNEAAESTPKKKNNNNNNPNLPQKKNVIFLDLHLKYLPLFTRTFPNSSAWVVPFAKLKTKKGKKKIRTLNKNRVFLFFLLHTCAYAFWAGCFQRTAQI
jgi:hypothetical protein